MYFDMVIFLRAISFHLRVGNIIYSCNLVFELEKPKKYIVSFYEPVYVTRRGKCGRCVFIRFVNTFVKSVFVCQCTFTNIKCTRIKWHKFLASTNSRNEIVFFMVCVNIWEFDNLTAFKHRLPI